MARTITERDINNVANMVERKERVRASQQLFQRADTKQRVSEAINVMESLINNCSDDNFEKQRAQFVKVYNSILDDIVPDINMVDTD